MSARRKRKAKRQAKRADSFSDKMTKIKRLTTAFPRKQIFPFSLNNLFHRTYTDDPGGKGRNRADPRSPRKSRFSAIEPHFWLYPSAADDWADRWYRYPTCIQKYFNSQNRAIMIWNFKLYFFRYFVFRPYFFKQQQKKNISIVVSLLFSTISIYYALKKLF